MKKLLLAAVFLPALACVAGASPPAKPAGHPAPGKPSGHPNLQHMQLQAQYAGPLQDTIIQRLRDPVDGTICYIYLPILVQHSPPAQAGFVQYGPNTIGSISCMPPH